MKVPTLKIIECPRDAMQGITEFIPTPLKIKYISQLLKVGFDTIDVGSFVSPKAIPQLRDTAAVLNALDWENSTSKLLTIVANVRGANEAATFDCISYMGFPMSISPTFQERNTNKTIEQALNELVEIKNICVQKNKKLVTYISMGFGNPYGDNYDADLVGGFVDIILALGADVVSLADTIGISTPASIQYLFGTLSKSFPEREIGIHLHSTPDTATEKIEAAYTSGCRRIDGAVKGFGGCPMADDELVGNLATENILAFLDSHSIPTGLNKDAFAESLILASEIFPNH